MEELKADKKLEIGLSEKNLDVGYGESSSVDLKPQSRFSSFLRKLEINSSNVERINHDLHPTPPERRKYKALDYFYLWSCNGLSASAFRTGTSYMEMGLSPKQALAALIMGNVFISIPMTLNGLFGSHYHIPFAIQSRASFGYYFNTLIILLRLIAGLFYYGTNVYTGAECIQTILYAIFKSFRTYKNRLPEDAGITSNFMICYFVYWVISVPFHLIRPEYLQNFFLVKSISTYIACFAMLIFLLCNAGSNVVWDQPATVSGSKWSWVFMYALNASVTGFSTLAVNVNDFTRYAKHPKAPYVQFLILPVIAAVSAPIGIISGVASKIMYGSAMWDPLEIANNWTSSGGRAAAFFMGFTYLISQIAQNISDNTVAAANDLLYFFPKYLDIRRAQIVVIVIGAWAIVPWKILQNGASFLAFLGSLSIFLGPAAGILIADKLKNHHKYNIDEFYNPAGIYRYNTFGTNWRALVAFLCGSVPLLPGMAMSINTNIIMPEGITHLYYIGYFYAFMTAFLIYYVLNLVFPAKDTLLEEAVYPPSTQAELVDPSTLKPKDRMLYYIKCY
ncbi:membrane transporter [Schizosaccharomyces cryophilus OY26]|uniref:Membrane transporter n=1 Tax=Schizosaccharomyces cryophilus (strain OY26 / ATCC MYA-4695 / CBS 11777 / NBRC 106824 / NRRL Y48691) TaxID=653667 RepID=S9W161_SCHCR|nr:membrane transporter [Schizosaccharomyces cryophilus OY26]EPY52239.1 membrane transporter [Schizosaccharomyces cryophilus OY26]